MRPLKTRTVCVPVSGSVSGSGQRAAGRGIAKRVSVSDQRIACRGSRTANRDPHTNTLTPSLTLTRAATRVSLTPSLTLTLTRAAIRVPAIILGFALATLSCTQAHINEYTPKRRDYKLPAESKGDQAASSPGSLWQEGRPASLLFTDARALRVNDLLVVKIDEQADAHRSTDTNTDRSSAAAAKIDAFMGLLKKLPSSMDPNLAIGGGSSNSFQSKGDTGRTEYLTATVPAVVTKVFNNGNLFVEGHRVILVNAEEQHFYISGVVRPIDIDQENTVKSSMVADAQIEFVGRGVLSDNQKPGWFSRMLGWMWPF